MNEKIEVISPRVDLDRLTTSIEVEIADRIGSSWDEWFGLLTRFESRGGRCRVPTFHVEGTFKLGTWVSNQRAIRDTMPAECRQRLDEVGFLWESFESGWEEGFAPLTTFKTREGHCRVRQLHIEGTFKLGQWVSNQRATKDTISAERRQRLDAIGFVWDTLESGWEKGFAVLATFKERESHCRVPTSYKEGTFNLGSWLSEQRKRRNTMSAERRQRLDEIAS